MPEDLGVGEKRGDPFGVGLLDLRNEKINGALTFLGEGGFDGSGFSSVFESTESSNVTRLTLFVSSLGRCFLESASWLLVKVLLGLVSVELGLLKLGVGGGVSRQETVTETGGL